MRLRSRRPLLLLILGLGLVGLVAYLKDPDGPEPKPVVRAAPVLPDPTPTENVAYFFDLIGSAKYAEIGTQRLPIWRDIGFPALAEQEKRGADYILDPARWPQYGKNPALLTNVIQLVAQMPSALASERLAPFIVHWLDSESLPPAVADTWSAEFRRLLLPICVTYPDERYLPFCVEEFQRTERVNDLRTQAVFLLLRYGRLELVENAYREVEEGALLRLFVLDWMTKQPPELRRDARSLEPLARMSLESGKQIERVAANLALLELGDEEAVDRLIKEYEKAGDDEVAAWFALEQLGSRRADPFIRKTCIETVRNSDTASERDLAFYTALGLLAHHWIGEEEVLDLLWRVFDEDPLGLTKQDVLFKRLLQLDRERVLAPIRDALRGDDPGQRRLAIDWVQRLRLKEAGPWLLELARKSTEPRERNLAIAVLVLIKADGVLSIVAPDLDSDDPSKRYVAASLLLDLGNTRGLTMVEKKLHEGDAPALEALVTRASSGGRGAIPLDLVRAVIELVADAPSERLKLNALLVLRVLGKLETVREGLIQAYRTEVSDLVADRIRETLVELAHR